MPKLNKKTADRVAGAETGEGGLKALPTGTYPSRLLEVVTKEGPKGPYWEWKYEVTEPVAGCFSNIFVRTSLSAAADWKLKESFDAHDSDTDTDTEELLGDVIDITISVVIIKNGARAGEEGNEVVSLSAHETTEAEERGEEPF